MKKLFSLLATLLVLALAIWIGRSLWDAVQNDVPALLVTVEQMLKDLD